MRNCHRWAVAIALAAATTLAGARAQAAPYIWDEDDDHIDDRVESVNLLGYQFSFEQGDTTARQRVAVTRAGSSLVYSVYVVYDHTPTDSDFTTLALVGMPVLHRYQSVTAVRSAASFAQIQAAAMLPGVERIEAIPVLQPMLHEAAGAIGVRDATERAFPTWAGTGGGDGTGVVIAFLDSGINDTAEGSYPGHESLAGRGLGGAVFVDGDSALDTPPGGSVNPSDRGGALTGAHGTHVASIALGSGGASGYAVGIAPAARFVDVKVISDAGVGTGLAEALDWCIANRSRNWGGPAGYEGIDVINVSASSLDASDGNDVAARLADHAAALGIVVVASMGNDGEGSHVPSPAGGDRVLAVGAFDHQRTSVPGDDVFASFANYGPRASDGDADGLDEQKPDLLAPGVAILAADGDLSTDGAQYKRLSGTSMSAAFVSGAAAALLSSDPGLTPGTLAELIRSTASRELAGAPAGQGGADPRWHSSIGFGVLDLYAAGLELGQSGRSQIVRLELDGTEDEVHAIVRTQREYGPVTFTIERAPDVAGAPGAFTAYDAFPGTGDPSLADADDRRAYERLWTLPASELGATYWYRVSYVQDTQTWVTPARRFVHPSGPPEATLAITIVHSALDHDLAGFIETGMSVDARGGNHTSGGGYSVPLPGTSSAVSSEWVTGPSTTGNVAWTYRIDVPAGAATSFLPPSSSSPWLLRLTEGGYLNRSGRIAAFEVIWHSPNGDVTTTGGPVPQPTTEGHTSTVAAPAGVLGVGDPLVPRTFSVAPNPVHAGGAVVFSAPRAAGAAVRIYDLAGREVARVPLAAAGGARTRWEARDRRGAPLTAGVYFAGVDRGPRTRMVVLR